jgi:hypothetical protein
MGFCFECDDYFDDSEFDEPIRDRRIAKHEVPGNRCWHHVQELDLEQVPDPDLVGALETTKDHLTLRQRYGQRHTDGG